MQAVQVGYGAVLLTIKGFELEDQELDEDHHLLFVFHNQVDVSALELQRYALPGVKGKVVDASRSQVVDVLSQHPEPTVETSIHEALNLGELTRCLTLDVLKFDHFVFYVVHAGWSFFVQLVIKVFKFLLAI